MIIVTAAIIEKDGKILIARRKKGKKLEGQWEFPGGKLEGCETPEDCLKRELKEEFNIDVKVDEFVGASKYEYSHMLIKLLAYKVTYLSGEFKLTDHDEINWVYPSEFKNYDFTSADIPIVNKLLDNFYRNT